MVLLERQRAFVQNASHALRTPIAVALAHADSGPGIPAEQFESVFERFESGGPRQREMRNFGLGLAIVRAVVDAHGGRVFAEHSELGGAAITLWLPIHDPLPQVLPTSPGLATGLTLQPA